MPVRPGRKPGRYLADFDADRCADCPLQDQCPTRPLKRRPARVLRVSQRQIAVAQLRARVAHHTGPPHLRPAVEATVRSLKHPFGTPKARVPVRGLARVRMMVVAGAFMVNARRIWRYQQAQRLAKAKTDRQIVTAPAPQTTQTSWAQFWARWRACGRRHGPLGLRVRSAPVVG